MGISHSEREKRENTVICNNHLRLPTQFYKSAEMSKFLLLSTLPCVVFSTSLPLPTQPQLRWQTGSGIMALIHFNMATFFEDGDPGCTSGNWEGETGSGNPNSFAPSALNVSQWVDSMVAIGVDEAVLTAKHGCGFYLWPTKVTLPDGSPYTYHVNESSYGDVLAQFRDATSARGIGHGFYYSLTNNRYLNVYGHSVQPGPLQPGQVNVTQQEFEDIAFDSVSE